MVETIEIEQKTEEALDAPARKVLLDQSWLKRLKTEFESEYMDQLRAFLLEQKESGRKIYPPGNLIFNSLNCTKFDDVKVVVIGQDPYHGPNQAHGLSFSVPIGVPPPPSLKNIFKELHSDLNIDNRQHGCLQTWANQGVLLLNAVLTVEHGNAGAHQGKGWERFTDAVIEKLNGGREGLVFFLWGSYAQKKGAVIDKEKHLVLTAPHPSPLSAHRGFFGCRHFSRANEYLVSHGKEPIDWTLPLN